MKRIATLFLILFGAGFSSIGHCLLGNLLNSATTSTTRSADTTYIDSAGASLNANTTQVSSPKEHIAQPTMPSNLTTMSDVSTFISNSANNCSAKPQLDTCFVALTASPGSTTTRNTPICPQGYALLYSTGLYVLDNSGNQMQWTGAFSQANLTQAQYDFYNSNGFSCSLGNSYNQTGNVAIDGHAAGTSCGWFCTYSADQPTVSQFKVSGANYNVGDWVNYNGQYGKLTNVTNNGYTCYTQPHVWAPTTSCTNWGGTLGYSGILGAYWETYSYGTFSSYTCTRSAGFYYDAAISNPNGYAMPSTSALPYTSPTVSICGKLKYSTNWQNQ